MADEPKTSIFQTPQFLPAAPTSPKKKRPGLKHRIPEPQAVIVGRKPGLADFLLGFGGGLFNVQQSKLEAEQDQETLEAEKAFRDRQVRVQEEQLRLSQQLAAESKTERASDNQAQDFKDAMMIQEKTGAPLPVIMGAFSGFRDGTVKLEDVEPILAKIGPTIPPDIKEYAQALQYAARLKGDNRPLNEFLPEASTARLQMHGDEQKEREFRRKTAELQLKTAQQAWDDMESGKIPMSEVPSTFNTARATLTALLSQASDQIRSLMPRTAAGQADQLLADWGQNILDKGPQTGGAEVLQEVQGLAASAGIDPALIKSGMQNLAQLIAEADAARNLMAAMAKRAPELQAGIAAKVKPEGDDDGDDDGDGTELAQFSTFEGPDAPAAPEQPGFLSRLGSLVTGLPESMAGAATKFSTTVGKAAAGKKPIGEAAGEVKDIAAGPQRGVAELFARDDATVVQELGSFIEQSVTDEGVSSQLLKQLGLTPEQFSEAANKILAAGYDMDMVRMSILLDVLKAQGREDAAAKLQAAMNEARKARSAAPRKQLE
jgi:hypothetical protein